MTTNLFQIMILRRDSVEPLYTPYQVPRIEDTTKKKIFETDSKEVLMATIKDLSAIYPNNDIQPYVDLKYLVRVVVSRPEFCSQDCEWFNGHGNGNNSQCNVCNPNGNSGNNNQNKTCCEHCDSIRYDPIGSPPTPLP